MMDESFDLQNTDLMAIKGQLPYTHKCTIWNVK